MNWFLKKVGFSLVLLIVLLPLSASDLLSIGDGDIGSFRIYDSQGNKQEVTEQVASRIGKGWIINNPETPVLIITPAGTINLFENTILITGDFSSTNQNLYLVQGKATFATNETFKGTLQVSTPVSQFKLQGKGEIFVISTDDEESITSFGGDVIALNGLSHARTMVNPFGKLYMDDPQRSVKTVQNGYYLTYATYPDLMLAKQLVSDLASTKVAPVPRSAKVSVLVPKIPKKPSKPGLVIMPLEIPSKPSVPTYTTTIAVAPAPQILSVVVKPQANPLPPSKIKVSSTLIPVSPKRIVITIRPVAPQQITTITSVISVPETIPSNPQGITATPALAEESVIQQTSTLTMTTSGTQQPAILSTDDDKISLGSFGAKTIYDFTYDGTNGNAISHSLSIRPYISYKSFALELNVKASTTDFSTYSFNFQASPSGALEILSYGASFVEKLRFGYHSSPFYLALDNSEPTDSDFTNLVAPSFYNTEKLRFYTKASLSGFSLITTFDDFNMAGLLDSKKQYGSVAFQYSGSENYPFLMSLGSLLEFANTPSKAINLYPFLSFKIPVVNNRNLQLGIIANASSYLPAYPTYDFSQFFNLTDLFPNYLINAGLSLNAGAFSALTLVSIDKGNNRSLLVNDFTDSFSTETDSDFNIFSKISFTNNNFNLNLLWNVPFAQNFTLTTLTADSSRKADLSQISIAFKNDSFDLSLGIQQIGIIDSISYLIDGSEDILSLFGGKYASSFISASYTLGPAQIKAKASYPVSSTSLTVPKLVLSAIIDLGKKF
ncbi:hypothetical protein [uncultured Sphaerochaeta sp.]|uniref:hypothetical protein n=1 Tax=uncultured Sphaerochaeta sp. TaxID=886478 RepID=UPI002A0A5DAF|nr:hypothetical protein [uncultured Sphaerochaeta sp.]